MAKINVYSSSASNAIKVFEYGSTATKPNDAILVTSADNGPANAIKVNVVNDYAVDAIPVWYTGGGSPVPPTPTWETVTIGDNVWMAENLKYDDGGKGILVSSMVIHGADFGEQYFYNYEAVQRISGDFPGWHIATKDDWDLLKNEVAGDCNSLRTTSGWYGGNNGNNLKGFNGEPIGEYNDRFYGTGINCFAYSINKNISSPCQTMKMNYDNTMDYQSFRFYYYYPIRLVKDSE